MRRIDIKPGDKYGRLTIIEEIYAENSRRIVKCKCDCGVIKVVKLSDIRTGNTKSCGCLNDGHPTHKKSKTKEYWAWSHIRQRCNNIDDKSYYRYGGRGIRVCERWNSFDNFYNDMGPSPGLHYSVDRIDNNGNYDPCNCRWATRKQQGRNKGNNVVLCIDGVGKTLSEWVEYTGENYWKIRSRIKYGWTHKDAVYGKIR